MIFISFFYNYIIAGKIQNNIYNKISGIKYFDFYFQNIKKIQF
jgi:hypothetical protein